MSIFPTAKSGEYIQYLRPTAASAHVVGRQRRARHGDGLFIIVSARAISESTRPEAHKRQVSPATPACEHKLRDAVLGTSEARQHLPFCAIPPKSVPITVFSFDQTQINSVLQNYRASCQPDMEFYMYVPDSCPICGFSAIKATLEDFSLTVNHGSNVGGVMAFRCSNSHIFFVRAVDLHLLADSVSGNGGCTP